jgi:serine/threonine protein kinase
VSLVGEVFAGRYELLEPIGEGGMGTVWAVRDLKLGEVRAAKLLRQSDAASLLRFIREQSMRIAHEHVVTPQTWSGEDDRVLFTMPLVRGGSVATLLGDFGPLPASWVGTLLDQTLQALQAVHSAGIVHRDVKPANLLLEPTGSATPHLLLTDFGVAVPVDEPRMTRASQVFATPGYTSDDQLRGADPDPRHDLYSVGMVGLEMVSGVRPPDAAGAARRRAADEPALRPLVDLLLRATAKDPRDRPASASEMRTLVAALELPAVAPDDGPHVFAHFGPDGTPLAEAPEHDAASGQRPTREAADRPRPRANPGRNRVAAGVLLLLAVACLVAAALILFG